MTINNYVKFGNTYKNNKSFHNKFKTSQLDQEKRIKTLQHYANYI